MYKALLPQHQLKLCDYSDALLDLIIVQKLTKKKKWLICNILAHPVYKYKFSLHVQIKYFVRASSCHTICKVRDLFITFSSMNVGY